MRVLAFLSLVAVAACASSGGGTTTTAKPATQTINSNGIGSLTINNQSNMDVVKMPYSADAIFRILPSVFDSLSIPVTSLLPATKTIGNPQFKTRQRLGKVVMSKYLDCGATQIGPNADSYDIVLNVSTNVVANGPAESTVTTTFEAMARPATISQAYSRCTSKGLFETRLTEIVKARLSKP